MDRNYPSNSTLISPYGGELINLCVPSEPMEELKVRAKHLPNLLLSERAVCDLELLSVGGFSPLDRFMNQKDYRRVIEEMRLANGTLFSIPILLPIADPGSIHLDQEVALRNNKNELLALMTVEEIYEWDPEETARKVFGTVDVKHPLVAEMQEWGRWAISGSLRVLQLPSHYDFQELRMTPLQVRAKLSALQHDNVVAFQTRNPLHRAHEEMTKRALAEVNGALLLHPVVGMTKPGDIDHFTRVRTYKTLVRNYYEPDRVLLSLLPLAMRLAGPREALWHALIRRNYGANFIIIGRDHAGPGTDSTGKPFYGPYDAQELVKQYSSELGMGVVPFREFSYLPDEDRYEESTKIPPKTVTLSLSGTQVREQYLNAGQSLPEWFTRPEVAQILAEVYPPRYRQGVCIWITGLSCSGKTTIAEILTVLLLEYGRQVTVLDGDAVRSHLSKGLGYNKEDRDTNIRRIGFVAAEIVHHDGIVLCAAISPYRATRDEVRNLFDRDHFVEVFVNTPLGECEKRDVKGLYAKARRGEIRGFTGIDDPYEPPLKPEITLDTMARSAEENAHVILNFLMYRGFVRIAASDIPQYEI